MSPGAHSDVWGRDVTIPSEKSYLCRITLLGSLRVEQADRVVTRFLTYKTGALLAYLAYRLPHLQSRETLIEMFWPEGSLERGRNNLSIAVSSLRHQLEPPGMLAGTILIADRQKVGLNPGTVSTDMEEFDTAQKAAASASSDAEQVDRLEQAMALYTGNLLPGYYEEWIVAERERMADTALQTLRRLTRLLARRKDLSGALDYALKAVTADPLREEAHLDLIKLYAASGQLSAALQQCHTLEHILKDRLDAAPSSSARRLKREIEVALTERGERDTPLPKSMAPSVPTEKAPAPPSGTVRFYS
jgi:DNA-binding SARP family transcriptional activator